MARISSLEAEKDAVRTAAQLMAVAARTAPKTRGDDSVKTLIVDGEDLEVLAVAMEAKVQAKAHSLMGFAFDAAVVRSSAAVLLIGVTGEPKKPENPLNCGACGTGSCAEFLRVVQEEGEDFRGPLCFFQSIDLGIALGSAVKTAGELNIDNRMMFTIGAAARKAGFLECDAIIGIPLSVSRKNPYFDRAQRPR